jgi:hypothetical protein
MYVIPGSDTYLALCFHVGFPQHNFAKVDFTVKWNIVSLQIDVMTFKINVNKIIWFWNISNEFVAKTYVKT